MHKYLQFCLWVYWMQSEPTNVTGTIKSLNMECKGKDKQYAAALLCCHRMYERITCKLGKQTFGSHTMSCHVMKIEPPIAISKSGMSIHSRCLLQIVNFFFGFQWHLIAKKATENLDEIWYLIRNPARGLKWRCCCFVLLHSASQKLNKVARSTVLHEVRLLQ